MTIKIGLSSRCQWQTNKKYCLIRLPAATHSLKTHWAAKQETSWIIAPWWFSVSLWRICTTFIWPRGSIKLPAPFSQSECHLHFASIRLCMALLFIISIVIKELLLRAIYSRSGKDSALIYSTQYTSNWNYGLNLNKFDQKTKASLIHSAWDNSVVFRS